VVSQRKALISICLCILVAHGCGRSDTQADLKLTHEVSPNPPRVGQARITMGLTDGSGKPVTRADLGLEGYMTHAGMKPITASVTELEPGRYVANMELSMAGDWVVVVHINLPGQRALDRQFEIKGVLP